MINWQSILSSFDDKPTLLEWLKKVQKALNESALTTVTTTQEKAGKVNSITLSFNFQDGTKITAPAFTVQDGADGVGITDIINTTLSAGKISVTYDTTDGITVFADMEQEYTGGRHVSKVVYAVPLMPGSGINIDKRANTEEVEIKVDLTEDTFVPADKVIGAGTAEEYVAVDRYGLAKKTANGRKIYRLPPVSDYKNEALLGENHVKTLFGNQSIVGTGNIDLYRHYVTFTPSDMTTGSGIRLVIYSSNNLKVDSLTDLKTLLGNTFEYPAAGAFKLGSPLAYYITSVTETGYRYYVSDDTDNNITPYPAGTWTDTVTTI